MDVFSPVVEPKVPAEQRPLQAGVPTAAVDPYRPMGHAMQTHAPVRLYCPAGHMDAVAVVDWEGQMKPAVQLPVQAVQYIERDGVEREQGSNEGKANARRKGGNEADNACHPLSQKAPESTCIYLPRRDLVRRHTALLHSWCTTQQHPY